MRRQPLWRRLRCALTTHRWEGGPTARGYVIMLCPRCGELEAIPYVDQLTVFGCVDPEVDKPGPLGDLAAGRAAVALVDALRVNNQDAAEAARKSPNSSPGRRHRHPGRACRALGADARRRERWPDLERAVPGRAGRATRSERNGTGAPRRAAVVTGVEALRGGELLIRDPATLHALIRLCRIAARVGRGDGIGLPPVVRALEAGAVLALERVSGSAVYRQAADPPPLSLTGHDRASGRAPRGERASGTGHVPGRHARRNSA